jgi:YgiT-type zinc finger domain-containing protein
MNCPLCTGVMVRGNTHILIENGEDSIIVINKVPALICEQCGDDFIEIEVSIKIEGLKMGFVDYTRAA